MKHYFLSPSKMTTAPVISPKLLGAELLGWESDAQFDGTLHAMQYSHLRWPGGIPVEDGIDTNGDGTRDQIFELRDPELLDWKRWSNEADKKDGVPEGSDRPGLSFILDRLANDVSSASLVLPTSRYAERILNSSSEEEVARQIDSDVEEFSQNLKEKLEGFSGQGREIYLEVGSEYYATDVWRKYNDANYDDDDLGTNSHPGLLDAYAKVFSIMVGCLQRSIGDQVGDVNIKIAVQTGRFQSRDDDGNYDGQASDSDAFIAELKRNGAISGVDAIVWHRYVNEFELADHGFQSSFESHSVEDEIKKWDTATGRDLEKMIGWLSPDVQYSGIPEFGPVGNANILQLFSNISEAGFDIGSIFGTNVNRPGALSNGAKLYSGGQLYSRMVDALPGLYTSSSFDQNVIDTSSVYETRLDKLYHFFNDDSVEIFIVAGGVSDPSENRTIVLEGEYKQYRIEGISYAAPSISKGEIGVTGVEKKLDDAIVRTDGSYTEVETGGYYPNQLTHISLRKNEGTIDEFSTSENVSRVGGNNSLNGVSDTIDSIGNLSRLAESMGFRLDKRKNIEIDSSFSLQFVDSIDDIDASHGTTDQFLLGNSDANIIRGGASGSKIYGLGGNDLLVGGVGEDLLIGGDGDDHLLGGAGADVFQIDGKSGTDFIHDFETGSDKIAFETNGSPPKVNIELWSGYIQTDEGGVLVQDPFNFDDISFI